MAVSAQKSWESRDACSFFHTFTDLQTLEESGPTIIARSEGPYVFDAAGKRYLEGNSGLWNMTLGFSEKRLVDVAMRQYESLPGYHTFFGRNSKPSIALAERLKDLAPMPMGRVFFTNSGSEANESVVKLLWMLWRSEGQPERRKLITRTNAYHGATVMASSLTGKSYVGAFGLPLPEVLVTECPHAWRYARAGEDDDAFAKRLADDLDALIRQEGPETIAGFFAEPVMGAGGVIVPPGTYFAHVQPVLRKHRIPLVCDEVICGFGRTGNVWGAETIGIEAPDIVVASKSISAGYFPMGAVLLSEEIDARLSEACRRAEEFPHGFTAGGHPVGCAISLEAIRIITEEGVLDHVRDIAPHFQERLRALETHPHVGEARGVGLMGALEIVADQRSNTPFADGDRIGERIAQSALERGLIIRPLGNSVVLAPPFILDRVQIDALFDVLSDAMGFLGS